MHIAMKQLYQSVQRMRGSVEELQDTHARTHGRTDGQYAILSLARFTEPLPDNETGLLEYSHLCECERSDKTDSDH